MGAAHSKKQHQYHSADYPPYLVHGVIPPQNAYGHGYAPSGYVPGPPQSQFYGENPRKGRSKTRELNSRSARSRSRPRSVPPLPSTRGRDDAPFSPLSNPLPPPPRDIFLSNSSVGLVPVYRPRPSSIPRLVAGGGGDMRRGRRILLFTQNSRKYSSLMIHSPHRIMYQNQTYPTGTHLFEALKFLPLPSAYSALTSWSARPELASQIQHTPNPNAVYALTSSSYFSSQVRPDWTQIYLKLMREIVLLTKFKQHPSIRGLLLETGNAELGYVDPSDEFWSLGRVGDLSEGDRVVEYHSAEWTGQNELGKALMWVRDRLRAEGYK